MNRARVVALLQLWGRCLRFAWAQLAWPEYLVLSLTLFTAGTVAWVNGPLRSEVAQLRAELSLRQTIDKLAPDTGMEVRKPDMVAAFLEFLPRFEERDNQIAALHALAAGAGIAFSRIAYTHGRLAQLPVRKTSLQLAFLATDTVARRWVHALLRDMPNLSVDRVELEAMASSGETGKTLSVRMEVSLFYRDEKGP